MRRHKDEIIRWLNSAEGRRVWINKNQGRGWYLHIPSTINCWYDEHSYIVDDEWAELRKAQADGKQLEFNINGVEWICKTLMITEDTKIENVNKWRIKPDIPEYEWQWIYQDATTLRFVLTETYHTKKPEWIDDCSKRYSASRFLFSRRIRK